MKIEKGIPIPEITQGQRGRKSMYPFKQMEIGDSVFFEGADSKSKQMAAAKIYSKRYGIRLIGRTVDGGLRIWRVE